MGRTLRSHPNQLTNSWPDAASNDAIGEAARKFVLNLTQAIGERSIRLVARDSEISHVTLLAILEGRTWPDLATIAKLEEGLNKALWPVRKKGRALAEESGT